MSAPEFLSPNSLAAAIAKGRIWLIAVGTILIIAGMLAMIFPYFSGLSVTIIVGISLVVAGIAQFFQSFSYPKWNGLIWALIVGVLWTAAGVYLLVRPLEGIFVLTVLLAAGFIIEGALKTVFAFQMRPLNGWGWMLFNGLLAAVLGVLLWWQLPLSAIWALGVIAGLNIFASGWTIIMIAVLVNKFSTSHLPTDTEVKTDGGHS